MNLKTQLKTLDEGKAFIEALHKEDKLFHFEDSPDDIVKGVSGERLFTDEEAEDVSERVSELYGFEWGEFECPIGYALSVMNNHAL